MGVRRKQIRELAQQVLEENDVRQPPVPVTRIAEAHGLLVARQGNAISDISGILYREAGRNIVGINTSHSRARQRFTIAHELGHFLLHTRGTGKVHIDRRFDVKTRDAVSATGTDTDEIEANLFAAELLMPYELLKEDLAKEAKLDIVNDAAHAGLAQRYGVSTQAMVIRLTNLRFIRL